MNAITTINRPSLPASATPTLDDSPHRWLAIEAPDRYSALPSPEDEAALRRELVAACRPIATDSMQPLLARMVGSFPQAGPADPRGYILALAEHLREYPADVLGDACREIVRTHRFLPTVSEVRAIAERLVARRRTALRNLDAVAGERARREAEAEKTAELEAANKRWTAAANRAFEAFAARLPREEVPAWTAWRALSFPARYRVERASLEGDDAALAAALDALPILQQDEDEADDPEAPF